MSLNPLIFQQRFEHFSTEIFRASGVEFVSFNEGLPAEWEGYKVPLRAIARDRLGFTRWQVSDVGKGTILANVVSAIEIADGPDVERNNLVAWKPRWGPKQQSHRVLLEGQSDRAACRRFERWCFDFFRGQSSDAEAFDAFIAMAGKRYDLVAYLFYLKNSEYFMPIAPRTFDAAFASFGIALRTSHHCSWANYVQYNDALGEIQDALRGIEPCRDARRIDAHSFCWMLTRLLPAGPSRLEPTVLPPVPLPGLRPSPKSSVGKADVGAAAVIYEGFFEGRDAAQRRLGRLAESIALVSEQKRLGVLDRDDLANAVVSVSDRPALGYDIKSFERDGSDRHIEVKAARLIKRRLTFFVTRNELSQSKALPNFYFYLVLQAGSQKPIVHALRASEVIDESLAPMSYLAAFDLAGP